MLARKTQMEKTAELGYVRVEVVDEANSGK